MKFEINGDAWEIEEVEKEYLIDRYNREHEQKAYYCFGLTDYGNHIVFINESMCREQKRRTLMHELMHVYLWEVGVCDNFEFNEEDICNFSASSHEIIEKVLAKYDKSGIMGNELRN